MLESLKNTRVPIDHKVNVDANYFIKKLNKELPHKIGLEKIGLIIVKKLERNIQLF